MQGFYLAFIGGLIVALISGSQLAVSGPAAGLSTLIATTIITLGDYRLFLLTVIVAGFFQLVLGLFKLGAIANYFPSSVIKGMLAAIGSFSFQSKFLWPLDMINLLGIEKVNVTAVH